MTENLYIVPTADMSNVLHKKCLTSAKADAFYEQLGLSDKFVVVFSLDSCYLP